MKEKKYLDYDGLERLVYQIGNHYADWDTVDGKQDLLESGENIKTINNQSLLGSGNINISSGGTATDVQINGSSITSSGTANIITNSSYDSNDNPIATMSDLPTIPANIVTDASYVHTDNNYTTTEKNKLSGIASRSRSKCSI